MAAMSRRQAAKAAGVAHDTANRAVGERNRSPKPQPSPADRIAASVARVIAWAAFLAMMAVVSR